MVLPFVLSSAYWAVQFAEGLAMVQVYMLDPTKHQEAARYLIRIDPLFNAIVSINVREFSR